MERGDVVPRLPSGPLDATDRTLDRGLRRWVRQQTGLEVGYVEQLYTFGDLDAPPAATGDGAALSVAYLALVRESRPSAGAVGSTGTTSSPGRTAAPVARR